MDTNWNYVWHKRAWSTASEESYWIAVDSNNNIYVAWYIWWDWDLYWKTVTGVMWSDWFITKVENE
jgi:hypothetical protein